ncbi:trehalose 6-phosphate synthase [Stella humosa]|uniref:Trehalose-6-phosphate synthase n=1 Tax=Stella humosa TaxID=94 RepID=A0A3N1MGY5_9PROT|nr:alpha,alpha-trehalose-phosphate synthase (UDP-forming) [Stella humosa]ROQ01900.1 trehalose 6-phosphate synthase [Stella humosa]BBK32289.1 trehalose-6-phosphate synthase [Stella humosa]
MARLVIVSNRTASPRDRGTRAGGLAVGLREALQKEGGLWFGWSGELSEAAAEPKIHEAGNILFATIPLTAADHDDFYVHYANGTLWPLCHYRLGLIEFSRSAYEGYLRVNRLFAERLAPLLRPDDIIWIHDYHFIPLASALRALGVANRIGFFLHIPLPAPEVLTALPRHRRLVADLCAYDLVGFQTADDLRAFSSYLEEERVGAMDRDGAFQAFGRHGMAAAFPIGIDTQAFVDLAQAAVDSPQTRRLADSLGGRRLVIGVDRLDYSKGIPQRMESFQAALESHPEHRGRVTYMQIAPISRGEVEQYRALRRELEGWVGRINGRFGEFDWAPVRYLNKAFPRQSLAGFYRAAAVGLVTPLRDGMNLVAKEYVAAQDPENPGVLVLSRFAGAARSLPQALIVNPFDVEEIGDAIHLALTMPLEERRARWAGMMAELRTNTIQSWCQAFVSRLNAIDTNRRAA